MKKILTKNEPLGLHFILRQRDNVLKTLLRLGSFKLLDLRHWAPASLPFCCQVINFHYSVSFLTFLFIFKYKVWYF